MPASYSELLLVMALKWAICGAKDTCCTQKIFHYKSVISFCGFSIKIENLFVNLERIVNFSSFHDKDK